jgi:hypothetical protein
MGKIRALLVEVGEKPSEVLIENSLEELQSIVQGRIEFYSLRGSSSNIICNEEGKLIGMPGNRLVGNEIICGDFLVVGDNGYGETVSLTNKQISRYSAKFKTPLEFTDEQVQDNIFVRVLSPEEFQDFIDPRPIPIPKKVKKSNKHKGFER